MTAAERRSIENQRIIQRALQEGRITTEEAAEIYAGDWATATLDHLACPRMPRRNRTVLISWGGTIARAVPGRTAGCPDPETVEAKTLGY